MTGRLACQVPFCRRTRGDRKGDPVRPGMEWICGKHWRLVSYRRRYTYSAIRRRMRRYPEEPRWRHMADAWWERCKTAAIEAAVGIG